jgi:hypothetical protein
VARARRGRDAGRDVTAPDGSRPGERTLATMPLDGRLREELLAMLDEHRGAEMLSPDARRAVRRRHADRIWAILDDYEVWPGFGLVGVDGARAAWLVVQESIEDPGLQHRCLELLEVAVDNGEAEARHHALLFDRVRMADGLPQIYGSQFVTGRDGELEPWPVDDVAAVDERRRRVGLPPVAQQAAEMQARWAQRSR